MPLIEGQYLANSRNNWSFSKILKKLPPSKHKILKKTVHNTQYSILNINLTYLYTKVPIHSYAF